MGAYPVDASVPELCSMFGNLQVLESAASIGTCLERVEGSQRHSDEETESVTPGQMIASNDIVDGAEPATEIIQGIEMTCGSDTAEAPLPTSTHNNKTTPQ